MMPEAEIGGMPSEDGGRGHKPRDAGVQWKLERARKEILPSELPKTTSSADTLTLTK